MTKRHFVAEQTGSETTIGLPSLLGEARVYHKNYTLSSCCLDSKALVEGSMRGVLWEVVLIVTIGVEQWCGGKYSFWRNFVDFVQCLVLQSSKK